jgi:cytochrome c oxidase subunit 2
MGTMSFRSPAASQFAEESDLLFFTLLGLTIIFTAIVAAMIFYLAIRYRRGNNVDRTRALSHNTLLELTWSVGPLILAIGVFVWSTKLFATAYAVPPNAKEVFVIGKQWMWHLQHANGIRENNELHIPVDEPVKLTMISQDVLHAFFVPEFRIQRHVQPGEYTSMWVKPTRVGKYHLYCNMYCGTQHSEMGGWVYVMSKADYQKWLASGGSKPVGIGGINTPKGGLSMAQTGAALYNQYQCSGCHSAEAVSRGRGPSLIGIYGKNRQMTDGRVIKADDGYLRNVVYYPNEYPLAGWPQGMPSYKGILTEDQVLSINAYIKTLGTGESLGNADYGIISNNQNNSGAPGSTTGNDPYSGQHQGRYGPPEGEGGNPNPDAPAANTDNIQWRYMYGGEQYQ